MGGALGAITSAGRAIGGAVARVADKGDKATDAITNSTTGEVISPDAVAKVPDILKPDLAPKTPAWQNMAKGAFFGGARGYLQDRANRPQGGGAVPIQGENPQLPGDFYQPSDYLTQARKRFDPFYGG